VQSGGTVYTSPPPPGYPVAPSAQGPYWQSPETLSYREGSPIPAGYRVEHRARTGLVVAGALVLGIPYLIGLSAVSTRGDSNGANWLLVPAIGPWLAIGARHSTCSSSTNTSSSERAQCAADILATTGLVFDGLVQTAGATLLIVGLALPKTLLVR